IKGGRLAQACGGRALHSLIISDVVGDRLDVIASGPTAPDPTTFGDAVAVLQKYCLLPEPHTPGSSAGAPLVVPRSVVSHLKQGAAGMVAETLKRVPENVHNWIIGNNATALSRAAAITERLGYRV